MALTRITKGVIKPNENYDTHNINSTGIVTATKFVGPFDNINVSGAATFTGNVTIGGTLTYEDVTNVDSVGIITAQKDIHVGAGVSAVGVGTFGSLDIGGDIDVDGHTNLDNVSVAGVITATGDINASNLTLTDNNPTITWIDTDNNPDFRIEVNGGNFTLHDITNAVNKFEITPAGNIEFVGNVDFLSGGVDITGNTTMSGDLDVDGHTELDNLRVSGIATVQSNLHLPDASKLLMGDNNEFRIYHNESNSLNYIVAQNNGPLLLRSSNADMIHCSPQGAVTLKYDGTTRAATSSSGFDVSGTLNVTGISTFAGAIDANGDLDVDGHTNLDNVSIAGVTTMGQTTIFTTGGSTLLLKDSDSTNPADRSGIAFVDQNNTQTAFIGKASASDAVLTINNTNTINPIRLKVNNTTRLEVGNAGVYATGSLSATGTLTAGGTLYIPDEIQHSGDADTKIRFPSNDTISFETAGGERININSTGRVTFSGQIFQANTSTTLLPTGDNYGTYAYTQYPHELVIDNNATGTQGSFAGIYFNAGADSDGSKVGTARISAVETGNYKADLVFSTRNTSFTEKLRIKANGYVGINTDNPARYLHIVGNDGPTGATLGNSDTQLVLDNKGVNGAIIEFLSDTNGGGRLQFTDTDGINRGRLEYVHSSDTMRFHTMGGERLVISSSGQLTVYGGANNTTLVLEADTNRSASLRIKNNGTEYASFQAGPTTTDQSLQIIRSGDNPIRFVNGSGGTENLRIESNSRVNFHTGNNDMTNPDIGGGTSGVSINKNTLGQIYACTDNASNTAANDYQTVCLNVSRRNTSGDGPQIALDRGGWIKASIAGLQGSNTATSGPGIFAVYTHDYSSGQNVRTERIRISGSNGNVGISDDQPSSIPRKLWIYEGSNDPYVRIQRGSTSSVIMGGYEIASSNGNGNNVLSTMYTRATANSGTTGATIFQVRDQANNYEIVRLCSQAQGAVQGNRMLVNGNQVCVFGSPHGTSGTAARDGNTTTYNTVYEHSNSSYRTSDNGMFGGYFVVGGNANYWYPVWFQQPTNCPPQELWINKYVHNYATWDGSLFFRATLCGSGYGAYATQHRVHYYSSSSKEFIGKIIYTGHNNAYLVCWMRGGGRSYGWGTVGGNGIRVNVGDDGNSHNLGPGNTSETYITNNLTIPQGYEQAMTTSGQHQQSDGF